MTSPPAASAGYVFEHAPQRVYWELTRACDLACRHCRAEAIPSRDPCELTSGEARALLEALRQAGGRGPSVVLTGGDPLKRPDFWELLEHGAALGLDMAVSPSGTPRLTGAVVERLARAGARAMSLSLDGADAARHDGFRGVPGCFTCTVEAARVAAAARIALQVNTLVTAETLGDLPGIAELVEGFSAQRWSLFFLIPVGRGRPLRSIGAALAECVLEWLWKRSGRAAFVASTTEAPHYRRVALQRMGAARSTPTDERRGAVRRSFGIRDGNGIMFVSHRGDVQPSGFLPLAAGNVRTADPVALYREAPLFKRLRDPSALRGRCGRCEFRAICGGSRARAYAMGGDPFGEDPLCAWEPARHEGPTVEAAA